MTDQGQSLIKNTLSNLTDIAKTVRRNSEAEVRQIKKDLECDDNASAKEVMKVLAWAVNEAIQKKVNLSEINTDDYVKNQFKELLEIPSGKSLQHYFVNPAILSEAKSPLDMAKKLKKGVPQWLAKNIIQHQFDIRWCTRTGKPNDYNFYQFCDMKNTIELLKYKPRAAHVKATLYKKCRSTYDEQSFIKSKEQLCPTVYIRTSHGWKSWQAVNEEFSTVEDINAHLSWIDPNILVFITQNADVQRDDSDESLKNSLKKPTLYWAVLEDGDFIPGGEKLKLKNISQTQVYVGKANNGIRRRWIDGDNHCEMMKKCLDNVFAMTTYDPLRLEGIQLVDARLALAKVRGERTALFVMKTFGDEVEKAKLKLRASLKKVRESLKTIRRQRLEIQYSNANLKKIREYEFNVLSGDVQTLLDKVEEDLDGVEKYLDQAEQYLDEVQLPTFPYQRTIKELQTELTEAKARVDGLRNSSDICKSVAKELLKTTEERHRNGKKDDRKNRNIILYDVLKSTWKPKDMRYGMNFS